MIRNFPAFLRITSLQTTGLSTRNYGKNRRPKEDKHLKAAAESLAARGFLRPLKPYDPPHDAESRVKEICLSAGINTDNTFIDSLDTKFTVLKACFDSFKHGVPNSLLHNIDTIDDLVQFYRTPVDTKTPFDALKKRDDLPKNLQIQKDYIRFHPETDTKFKGISAFPKSSTLVTGLKTRKKYQGHEAKMSWP